MWTVEQTRPVPTGHLRSASRSGFAWDGLRAFKTSRKVFSTRCNIVLNSGQLTIRTTKKGEKMAWLHARRRHRSDRVRRIPERLRATRAETSQAQSSLREGAFVVARGLGWPSRKPPVQSYSLTRSRFSVGPSPS